MRPAVRLAVADVAPRADVATGRKAISATLLTRNSRSHLRAVLESLQWCDEVIVLDTGSTDDSLDIAAEFGNCSIHRFDRLFEGFGAAHQHAVSLARNDWILSVDSDEVISPELAAEILALQLDPACIYSLGFHTYVCGRLLRPPRWYLERHCRLFNRQATNFTDRAVHEKVRSDGMQLVKLVNPVRHYSYDSLDDYLRKMQSYSTLFAQMNHGRRSSGPLRACLHGFWAFIRYYLLKGGVTQGFDGFALSLFQGQTTLWKYLKLHEANRRRTV
ncbi:MAG: glycosyltransferase family 2 protein [Steroidobacteraceae bacterium]